MTKRACKRMVREGAFTDVDYDDGKIRRLPIDRGGWSPLGPAPIKGSQPSRRSLLPTALTL